MSLVLFVRHSVAVVSADEPPSRWRLSPDGRSRARALGGQLAVQLGTGSVSVVTSSEVKAIETAELLDLGPVRIDRRVREVSKPWYPSSKEHDQAARDFLAGHDWPSWENRSDALGRFSAALDDRNEHLTIVVTHGTVLSLWIAHHCDDGEAGKLWLDLKMPDAHILDWRSRRFERVSPDWTLSSASEQ